MPEPFDLQPVADAVKQVVADVSDDQLHGPTPCASYDLGAVLDHLMGLTVAFTVAGLKADEEASARALVNESQPGRATTAHLQTDWRTMLPSRLDDLAAAWRDPAAYEGVANAGGVQMPAEEMSLVALDELVLHGWDAARATGRPFAVDDASAQRLLAFVRAWIDQAPDGTPGMFGPPRPVPDGADALTESVALSGRDPGWAAPAS